MCSLTSNQNAGVGHPWPARSWQVPITPCYPLQCGKAVAIMQHPATHRASQPQNKFHGVPQIPAHPRGPHPTGASKHRPQYPALGCQGTPGTGPGMDPPWHEPPPCDMTTSGGTLTPPALAAGWACPRRVMECSKERERFRQGVQQTDPHHKQDAPSNLHCPGALTLPVCVCMCSVTAAGRHEAASLASGFIAADFSHRGQQSCGVYGARAGSRA